MYKSIKKVALIIAVVFVSVNMTAQKGLMVNFGYININSISKTSSILGELSVNLPLDGFLVGAGYDLMFTENLGINAGLNYSLTFGKVPLLTETYNVHTLYVPVRFMYQYALTDDVTIFAYAGPKFSFDVASSGSINDNKKFNLLVGPGVGVTYQKYGLQLGYDLGLINRISTQTAGITGSIKTNNFYISLIYKF